MFTGIVAEIGTVKSLVKKGSSAKLSVTCKDISADLDIGASVAVNGVCLSVTNKDGALSFDVVGNTLSHTNLKKLKTGSTVNLEHALKAGDSLSGHIVSGHIDGERKVKKNQKASGGWILDIEALPEDKKYLIDKGSVAIDGVSLTIGEVSRDFFRVFLIPLTLEDTTLKRLRIGDYVNVEFDMMAKYAEKGRSAGTVTKEMLSKNGFI